MSKELTEKESEMNFLPDNIGNELTNKQIAFANAYSLNGNNGAAAAIAAGYAPESAKQEAYRLRKNPKIKELITVSNTKIRDLKIVGQGDLMELLEDIAYDNEKKNPMVSLASIDKMTKLMGLHVNQVEIKQEVNHSLDNLEEIESFLKDSGINIDDL